MQDWKHSARQALVSGTAASLFSAAVMAVAGRLTRGSTAAGPLNGPSQWLFGRQAAHRRAASLKYTLSGILIHHAAAVGWAVLHERIFGTRKAQQTTGQRLRNAATTAAVANFVDYKLTPKRLQPGFETQLSRKSVFAVYAAFALGLTLYDMAKRNRRGVARRP